MLPASNKCTITHWPVVHASMSANTQLKFYGTDSQDRFEENLKNLESDWIYRSKAVTYNFNNVGLRMNKNIQEVDPKYFVAFGCSQTLGVGVALEDTWPMILSQDLGIDYINSAVVGSSIKLNVINFFNMLESVDQLPYAVVFAWPSSSRYCFYTNNEFVFYLPNYIPDIENFTDAYNSLLLTDFNFSESILYRNMVRTTCKQLGIKYVEFSFDKSNEFTNLLDSNIIDDTHLYARDNSHIGILQHREAASYVKRSL